MDKVCLINHGKIAACTSPEKLKQSLLRQELILDAEDRPTLTNELSALGLPYTMNGHVVVPYTESAQGIISRLQTKLTVFRIHEPSLEDAYVEFLNKAEAKTEAEAKREVKTEAEAKNEAETENGGRAA